MQLRRNLQPRIATPLAPARRAQDILNRGPAGRGESVARPQVRTHLDLAVLNAGTMEKADTATTPETLRAFALAARKRLLSQDCTYRRDHLRVLAQRVEVDGEEVRIMGWKTELLRTLVACAGVGSAEFRVRGFIGKWRARKDSNLRPPDS